jgi:hypothetical protein
MGLKNNKVVNYGSLLSMTIITVFSIINKETTVFYILYLFWCDELIRTLSDGFKYVFKKSNLVT